MLGLHPNTDLAFIGNQLLQFFSCNILRTFTYKTCKENEPHLRIEELFCVSITKNFVKPA